MIHAQQYSADRANNVCGQQPDQTAECVIDGTAYSARSPYELARALVAAGIADAPMTVTARNGEMIFSSIRQMAGWTVAAGSTMPVRLVRYPAAATG